MSKEPKERTEEIIKTELYAAVGTAISAWSFLEESLCAIFVRAVITGPNAAIGYASASFWAIESFQGKISMVDAAIRMRLAERPDVISLWEVIKKRAREKNSNRNELAHGTVMNFGKREDTYWVPSFFKTLMKDVPRILAESGNPQFDIRPMNRLTAKEIDHRTQGFKMFTVRLNKFNQSLFEALHNPGAVQRGPE
jgi:hypothetical protein